MNEPLISVVLPAYNASATIGDAIRSILKQSYTNFELILIDDGSTDETVSVIESFNDDRIRLLRNAGNQGLIATLNRGLLVAKGKYVARMDADDISTSVRFEAQLDLSRRLDCDIVGSWIQKFGEAEGIGRYPVNHEQIRIDLLFGNPLVHPSVFFHRRLLDKGLFYYDPQWKYVEDYELWIKLMDQCTFASVGRPLLKYRISKTSVCAVHGVEQVVKSKLLREQVLQRVAPGISTTGIIEQWMANPNSAIEAELDQILDYICSLNEANLTSQYFNPGLFKRILLDRYFSSCLVSNTMNQVATRQFFALVSRLKAEVPIYYRYKLMLKGLTN